MSRASALLEREVQLQEFYGNAPAKTSRSKAHNLHRVLGTDEQGKFGDSQTYRMSEELFAPPLSVSPVLASDQPREARAVIAGRDSTPYYYPYASTTFEAAPPPSVYYHYQEPWQDTAQYAMTRPAIRSRLGLPGKRLPLFIILSLMALGLVVAITPVLARGKTTTSVRQSRMALSGYVSGSTTQADNQDEVPVIDVTSKPLPLNSATTVQSEIATPKTGGEILGSPSISVAGIESVLNKYRSPAAGKGQALYDLGVKYGINPAYALAFFVHESGCGTKGVARFTKSLGNIRTTAGYADYEGYRSYPNWEMGMEDWYKLISEQYVAQWGLKTVDAIIPVYAPWGDNNNPPTYIASVKGMVDSWRGK